MLEDSFKAIEAVQIGCSNARRLASLWEMMNQLDVSLLAYVTSLLSTQEPSPPLNKMARKAAPLRDNSHLECIVDIVDQLETIFRRHRIVDCVEYCLMAKDLLSKPMIDPATMASSLNTLKASILKCLKNKKLLQVSHNRFEFVDEDALFGELVKQQYPTASRDLVAAADCFAAECPTAAVFHLMRAMEVGLRSLARDRRIPFSDKPTVEKDWRQILRALETVVLALRAAPLSNWGGVQVLKDRQINFYSGLARELRQFEDAWKSYLYCHYPPTFYSRDQAATILEGVRALLQSLAVHISETSITEEFWTN